MTDNIVTNVLAEFKASPLFYSLLFWIFLWLYSITVDKYHHKFKVDETNLGLDFMRRKMVNEDKMEEIQYKLEAISQDLDPPPKWFYLDSGIIEGLYSILEFRTYSKSIWRRLMELLDQFLEIDYYCNEYPADTHLYMDNLLDLKKNILNELHSMVYNIPAEDDIQVSPYKLYKATGSLQYILNFHLEQLRIKNNQKFSNNGPNTRNKWIHKTLEQPYIITVNPNTKQFNFY